MTKMSRVVPFIIVVTIILTVLFTTFKFKKDPYQQVLDEGWYDFIDGLNQAQQHLTSLSSLPPPTTERNLVDGYRYLMGHLIRIASDQFNNDPLAPRFQRAVSFLSKWTGDNADAVYLMAPIDGQYQYRITGSVPYYQENRAANLHEIPQAPGLVLVAVNSAVIGDTGSMKELTDCSTQTLSALDSFQLQIEPDGRFDILLGPEKPESYVGNFLDTQVELDCKNNEGEVISRSLTVAKHVVFREIFFDWEQERPLDLDIVRVGYEGVPPQAVSVEARKKQLSDTGELVANQIKFWNYLQYIGLELYKDVNMDGERRQPINGIKKPAPPFIAGGTAGARQLYAAGTFQLQPSQAVIITMTIKDMPAYIGFHLANGWMESLDQANYLSSRNHHQLEFDNQGNTYLVVANQDPGVANWVDTTGLPEGAMNFRFYYEHDYDSDNLPVIDTQLVNVSEVQHLLPHAKKVGADDRRDEIAIRQKHMRQRIREY